MVVVSVQDTLGMQPEDHRKEMFEDIVPIVIESESDGLNRNNSADLMEFQAIDVLEDDD